MDEWVQFDQSIIDAAINHGRRPLSACIRLQTFCHLPTLVYYKLPNIEFLQHKNSYINRCLFNYR